jgi:hypothetical protein
MIKNQMNGVFVHVMNLKNSVKWYADLLGLEIDLEQVKSPVFNIPIVGTTSHLTITLLMLILSILLI